MNNINKKIKTDKVNPDLPEEDLMIEKPMENPMGFKVIIKEFKKDKIALLSLILFIVFIAFVFITSAFMDMEKLQTVDIFHKYGKPSTDSFWNIFGKDAGGRSVLGLTIVGARNSITIGFAITFLTTIMGLIIGLVVGYFGGKVDTIVMRVVDFISLLPILMIVIVFTTIVKNYTVFSFIFIMSLFYWIGAARLVRSKALSEGRRDYVNASKTMGTNNLKIMFGGILPNISSIIIVDSTLALAGNIGIETSLSFLGFGLPISHPSLGTLIALARKPEIIQSKMYVWVPASLVILFMMLCINYIGQALRRASDAKQRLG